MNKYLITFLLLVTFQNSSFSEARLDTKKALTQIYKAICLAEEDALEERKKLIIEHDKKYPQIPGFPKLEANPNIGPKTPLEIIGSINMLSVSSMAFASMEAEKEFYKELENDRTRLMKLFWKFAAAGPYNKKDIIKFAKNYQNDKKIEIDSPCKLSDGQKSRLLMEIF